MYLLQLFHIKHFLILLFFLLNVGIRHHFFDHLVMEFFLLLLVAELLARAIHRANVKLRHHVEAIATR